MPEAGAAPGAWRLLVNAPADGAWNLALDEAILDAYAQAQRPPAPTLRLYGWRPAALSLGRFQDAAASHAPDYLRAECIDLVRRPTGGRAVLHDRERTYAVIGRLDAPPFGGGVLETYRRIGLALEQALLRLGIAARAATEPSRGDSGPACFAGLSAFEVAAGAAKLVGSAQLRRRRAFLQHGSLPLRLERERLRRALGLDAAALGPLGDLETARAGPVAPAELDAALVFGFRQSLGVELVPGEATLGERERATWLRCWKHTSVAWTLHGQIGERELAWGARGAASPPGRD